MKWIKASERLPDSWDGKQVRLFPSKLPLFYPEKMLREGRVTPDKLEWLDATDTDWFTQLSIAANNYAKEMGEEGDGITELDFFNGGVFIHNQQEKLNDKFLLHLVDVVWQTANEDESVPSTIWAMKMIEHAKNTYDEMDKSK
jgi:hypothetical protein